MISYDILSKYLQKYYKYNTNIRDKYLVITNHNISKKYHITIFRDQWDDYSTVTTLPFHLFHLSSDDVDNRCSSYFWINKKNYLIQKIPNKYFQYNQPVYNFSNSTRSPCNFTELSPLLKFFQKILKRLLATF